VLSIYTCHWNFGIYGPIHGTANCSDITIDIVFELSEKNIHYRVAGNNIILYVIDTAGDRVTGNIATGNIATGDMIPGGSDHRPSPISMHCAGKMATTHSLIVGNHYHENTLLLFPIA